MTMDPDAYKVGRNCLQKLFEVEMGQKLDFKKKTRASGFRCTKNAPDLPSHGLQIGESLKVRLLGLNPEGLFVIKILREKQRYEDLKSLLKEYCNTREDDENSKGFEISHCSVGDLVCCNAGNDIYIRGSVLRIDDVLKLCFVLDIDEYRSHAVDWTQVFPFAPEFGELPARVVPCLLEGVNSRNFAFQPAIHSLLSRTHGNVILKVIGNAERKRWDATLLVNISLPNGTSLAELIVKDIYRHADELPLVPSRSVFQDCQNAVALQPFISPLLRFEKYDRVFEGENADKIEAEAHISMESYFRHQSSIKGRRMDVDTVYGNIATLNHREIPWQELGYRHWYCCLYLYHHLFEVKSSPTDHEGKIYIVPAEGTESEDHGQRLIELKPEILLSMIPEIKVDGNSMKSVTLAETHGGNWSLPQSANARDSVSCGTRTRFGSSFSSMGRVSSVPLQPLNRNHTNNSYHQRSHKSRINKDVLEKDAEIAQRIASAVTFAPEVPPSEKMELKIQDLTDEISPYIFYPQEWASLNTVFPTSESALADVNRSLAETQIVNEDTQIARKQSENENLHVNEPNVVKNVKEDENSIELDCPQAFLRVGESFSAKLCGTDMFGFFYVQRCDPGFEEKYSLLYQNIQDFYGSDKVQALFCLAPSAINVGDIVIAQIGDQFLRSRVFQYRTSKQVCNVVDLEDHEFHQVAVGKMFKPMIQFLRMPPKAIVCSLQGLEAYMFTKFIPDAMAKTTLEVDDDALEINVVESLDENLRVPIVRMKLSNGEEMSRLIITSYAEDLKATEAKKIPDDFAPFKPILQVYLPRISLKV